MSVTRWIAIASTLLATGGASALAWAQSRPALPTTPAPAAAAEGGTVGVVVLLTAVLLLVSAVVELYDQKRKRDEQGAAVQWRVSDALHLEPSLAGLPITASVSVPFWRRSPTVAIVGRVPTPRLREAAVGLVQRELFHLGAAVAIEDRIVVDPLMFMVKQVVA
jgi:hypothetical protein